MLTIPCPRVQTLAYLESPNIFEIGNLAPNDEDLIRKHAKERCKCDNLRLRIKT